VNQFDIEHGDYVVIDRWILYHDGASRDLNPWGLLCPAPKDPKELAANQMQYWQFKLNAAKDELKSLRKQALSPRFYGDQEKMLNDIKTEAANVEKYQAAFEEDRNRYSPPPTEE